MTATVTRLPCDPDIAEDKPTTREPRWFDTAPSAHLRIDGHAKVQAEYLTDPASGAEYVSLSVFPADGGHFVLEMSFAGEQAFASALRAATAAKAGA